MADVIWKDIPGYEGIYQISNLGNVYSVRYKRYRRPRKDKDGYAIIGLNKDGGQRTFFVHRLVAETFIPNPDNKEEVNHIDGDKTNNTLDNLEWCDHHENIRHAYATGLMPHPLKPKKETVPRDPGMKLTRKQVQQIRSEYRKGMYGYGCKVLAKKYGVTDKMIKRIVRNEAWKE